MPNEYSIEIHNYISSEIASTEQELGKSNGETKAFLEGKLAELHRLRDFLQKILI